MLGTMYPNYPSFSAIFYPGLPQSACRNTDRRVHVWHAPTAAYSTMSSSSQQVPTGLTWYHLCCPNYGCYNNTVGKAGKAAVGGYWEEVVKEPCYVLPVTGTDEGMNNVMGE